MFGREHLERAVKAEALSEHLKDQLERTIEASNRRNHELSQQLRDAEEKARDLELELRVAQTHADELTRDQVRRINEVHELDKKNAVLLERLDLMANYGFSAPAGPKALPEDAEDALFQHRAGLIDTPDLEEILKQSGFENAEVEFANEFARGDYPRLSQT